MNLKFCCLMLNGPGISLDISEILLDSAIQMYRGFQKRKKVRSPLCQGVLTTDFERTNIGPTYGTRFSADLVTERGPTQVVFIVKDSEIQNIEKSNYLAWTEFDRQGAYSRIRRSPLKKPSNLN